MSKKPIIHAFTATLYIVVVVLTIDYLTGSEENSSGIIVPIAMLSLFVLSAAIMGYLFLSQPIQLYLEGEKKKATTFFMQTVAAFAGITALIFVVLFSKLA